jgi:hypothetical protein
VVPRRPISRTPRVRAPSSPSVVDDDAGRTESPPATGPLGECASAVHQWAAPVDDAEDERHGECVLWCETNDDAHHRHRPHGDDDDDDDARSTHLAQPGAVVVVQRVALRALAPHNGDVGGEETTQRATGDANTSRNHSRARIHRSWPSGGVRDVVNVERNCAVPSTRVATRGVAR